MLPRDNALSQTHRDKWNESFDNRVTQASGEGSNDNDLFGISFPAQRCKWFHLRSFTIRKSEWESSDL